MTEYGRDNARSRHDSGFDVPNDCANDRRKSLLSRRGNLFTDGGETENPLDRWELDARVPPSPLYDSSRAYAENVAEVHRHELGERGMGYD